MLHGKTVQASTLERIIGALPVPYAVSAALFATLFGPPATVVLGLLATGSWSATVDLYFGGQPPDAVWQQVAAVLVWWLTYFVILGAIRWERTAVLREDEALARVKPSDLGSPPVARYATALWPAVSVGIILAAVSWPFVGAVVRGLEGAPYPGLRPLWVAQNLIRLGLFFWGLGTLFWLTTAALLSLAWLGRQPLELMPLEDDGLLGLRPAGSIALVAASTYFGIASLLALQLALAPAIGAFGSSLAVAILLGVVLFLAPLWELHRKMVAVKEERQAEVRSRLLELAFARNAQVEPERGSDDPGDLKDLLARATEVLALEAAGRKLDASATWPFDLDILRRLGAVMLPIVIALLTELVRQALGL